MGILKSAPRALRALNSCKFKTTIEGSKMPLPFSPCISPSSSAWQGDFGEDCSSPMAEHVVCALPGRVPQPPCQDRQSQGHLLEEEARHLGGLLLRTFLGRSRKVRSRRATPGIRRRKNDRGSGIQDSKNKRPVLTVQEKSTLQGKNYRV